MEKRRPFSVILYILILALLVWLLVSLFGGDDHLQISYSQMRMLFEEAQVSAFTVEDGVVTMELRQPYEGETTVSHELASISLFYEDLGSLITRQLREGVLTEYNYEPQQGTPWYLSLLLYVGAGVILIFVMFWLFGRANNNANNAGMKFGRANIRVGAGKRRVTFDDVAGADEEKAELQEIVDFLRQPEKYRQLGAKIPKGVLLVGPPGTGKTLLARAVAGEANVQFLTISGSDFVELYVGVGASRVRDLFEQAKKGAPSIVFIDEIDAVGRRRGAGLGGGHDEREQTLNQLLVEMDGFEANEGVIVMAATNRQDILDPALLRPGRFDRQVYVDAPDVRGREAILKVHAKDKRMAEDVDLKTIARATAGFTGADLANLLNEAALYSARTNCPVITMAAIETSMLKVVAGPEKPNLMRNPRDRRITAVHEAGHAVVSYFLPTQDPVHRITIVPRGNALGMTINLPDEDSIHNTRNEMLERIVVLLGGRVAEEIVFDDISTGASNDLKRATQLAHSIVAKFGMSKRIGAVSYDNGDEIFVGRDYERTRSYSERTAGDIDDEMKQVIDRAYAQCTELLKANFAKLTEVSQYLLDHENMSRLQFEACMKGEPIPADAEGYFDSVQTPPAGQTPADAEDSVCGIPDAPPVGQEPPPDQNQ